jgi:hypothetical protein
LLILLTSPKQSMLSTAAKDILALRAVEMAVIKNRSKQLQSYEHDNNDNWNRKDRRIRLRNNRFFF